MIKLSVNLSLLLLGLCVFGTQLLSAQQAKTITKPTKQVTEITLPTATKTEQYTPPVKGVGVVIKKNPGSGASKISGSTNAQGETTIEITEKGNYSFTVKSQTDLINVNNQVKTKGGPIQGVRIGLAKNPPGIVSRWVVPDKNGDVLFTDLEPGSYKVVVLTDGINCPPGFVMNNGVCEPISKVKNPDTKVDGIAVTIDKANSNAQASGANPNNQSCCRQGAWDELNYFNSKNELKALGKCGSALGEFSCGETLKFKTCFLCADSCGQVAGNTTYQIFDSTTNTPVGGKITNPSCSAVNLTLPSQAGKYYVALLPSCGSATCEPCMYYFTTRSTTDCCTGGKWIPPFLPGPNPTGENPLNYVVTNPASGSICGKELQNVKCNSYLNFRYAYQCNTTNCNATITYVLRNETTKAIVKTYPNIENSKNLALLTPTLSGRYSVEAIVKCGDKTCDTCIVYFTLTCGN